MNTDDPKFTAHGLGELEDLTPAERAEIEALLASDPSAAADATETQALAARLRAELTGEEAAPLHEAQHAAVMQAAAEPVVAREKIVRFPRRATVLAAIAACLVVGISVALLFPAMQAEKEAVQKSLAAHRADAPEDAGALAFGAIVVNTPTGETNAASELKRELTATADRVTSTPALQAADATPLEAVVTTVTKTPKFAMSAPVPAAPATSEVVDARSQQTPEQLKRWQEESEAFYATGRFELAQKRSEQILKLQPTDQSATLMKEKAGRATADRGLAAHNQTRANATKSMDLAWQRALGPPDTVVPTQRAAAMPMPAATPAVVIAGQGGLTIVGGKNTYTGATTVNGGTLALGQLEADGSRIAIGDDLQRLSESETRRRNLAQQDPANTDGFDAIIDNAFLAVRENPLSTFSIDVDTASYSLVRRFLNNNQRPPNGAVRIEELLNYFTYDYPQPQGDAPFSATMEVAACPWMPEHRLVSIGLKGREIAKDKRPASNLVFLIDVSGSMQPANRLPLVKESLALLIDQLGGEDQVAMVVYAESSGCVLEPTNDKAKMHAALRKLEAGGSTNGASGIQLAYQLAQRSFIKGGTNRVILATDGDWNVGITNQSDLLEMIAEKAKGGVFLTVMGCGMGNLKDTMLVKLAGRGNGNYAYIDTLLEAKKVLVEQLSGTLVTIAKDVKIQVEFNPAQAAAYRLIGYEKRMLAKEDFNNDQKDAGEIGAGHTVTALYEVVPAGKELPQLARVDALKYQPDPSAPEKPEIEKRKAGDSSELLTLKLRYKAPDGDTSKLLEFPLTDAGANWENSPRDLRFAAAVAGYGMLLRDSPHKGSATWSAVAEWAVEGKGADANGYRAEFLSLLERAKALTRQ